MPDQDRPFGRPRLPDQRRLYRRLRRALIELSATIESLLGVLSELEESNERPRLWRDNDFEWRPKFRPGDRRRHLGRGPYRHTEPVADENGEWERRPEPEERPRDDEEMVGERRPSQRGQRRRNAQRDEQRDTQDAVAQAIDLAALRETIERLYELSNRTTRN